MADLWSWTNYVDKGTITSAAGAHATMPLAHLKDPRVGRIWRANVAVYPETIEPARILGFKDNQPLFGYYDPANLSSEETTTWAGGEIRVDLGAARPIGVVGVFNSNFSKMTQIILKLGTTPGAGNVWRQRVNPGEVVADSMVVRAIRTRFGVDTIATARYLTIGWAGGVRLQAGRLWVGAANWRPQIGHAVGSSARTVDYSTRAVTPKSGAFLIDRGKRRRTFTANYDSVAETEYYGALANLDREAGLSEQILFVPNPNIYDEELWPVLGYLQDLGDTEFTSYLRATRSLSILENG